MTKSLPWRTLRLPLALCSVLLTGLLLSSTPALASSEPEPTITGVNPGHGAPAGGTKVTITGTNFTGATSVEFGSNNATSFAVESDTKITAVTPAFSGGSEDAVGVFVTTPGGTNTSEECGYPVGYRYEPTITKVEPSSGPAAGGTHVTIHGAAFEGTQAGGGLLCSLLEPVVQSVKFGSKEATHWNVESDREITAVAPAGAGTVDVTIESVVGTSPLIQGDQFSYDSPGAPEEPITGQCNPLVIKAHEAFEVCGTLNPHSSEKLSSAYFAFNEGSTCTGRYTVPASTEFAGELEGENIYVYGEFDGLKAGSEYTYCLVGKNSSGETFGKPATLTTTAQPKTEATASVTSTSAILEGALEPAGANLEYEFQYSKGASCQGEAATQSAQGEDKVSAKVEGLTPNTEYTVCLVATKHLAFYDTDTAVGTPQTFRTLESQAEKEAWFKTFAEENARKVAEEAAVRMRHEEEVAAAATKKHQEEAAAASHKQEEEAAPKKKKEEAPATGGISLAATDITVQSDGVALVKLDCLGIASCHGKLTLTAKSSVKGKGAKNARKVTIGTVSFSIAGDEAKTEKIKLNTAGRALLIADHGHCSANLRILELAPSPKNTQTKTVLLVQQKARGKTGKPRT